jgi:hypothetical protein
VVENIDLKDAKTKALLGHFSGLEITNALIIDGAEVEHRFRAGRAQHSAHRRAADSGHQRL